MNSTRVVARAAVVAVGAVLLAAGSAMADDWTPTWTTATLSQARERLAATSVDGKVFFGGGYYVDTTSHYSNVVDIFDATTLTRTTTNLSQARCDLAGTSAGGKVFFGGGYGGINSNVVDVFDATTMALTTTSLSQGRPSLAATTAGGKVFFGGGGAASFSNVVDIFDPTTLARTTTSLSQQTAFCAATSAGNNVFFGGGVRNGVYSNVLDVFDAATLARTTLSLSQARDLLAAASAGGKVFYAGGYSGTVTTYSNVVDIFDATTLTRSTGTLSQARYQLSAVAAGGKVFFAGGVPGPGGASSNVVDIYDTTSGTWSIAQLSQARWNPAAAAAGNKAFFAGGWTGSADSNVVDIYTFQSYDSITSTQAFTLVDQTTVAGRMQLNGGSLNLGTYSLSVGSMSGTAPISLSGQALTAGGDDTSSTYSGGLTGHGGLTKTGAGTLTLSGTSSYDGTTHVSGGTLAVTGSIASSSVVVDGGTLQGTGQVGAITGTSGHLHPGRSPGILQSGSLAMAPGFNFDVDLDSPTAGTGYSQLAVVGTVNLGGATLEAALGYIASWANGGPKDLLFIIQNDGTDPVVGQFNGLPQMSQFDLLYDGKTYEATISYQGDYATGSLTGGNDVVVAVPEPATLALLAAGAATLVTRRRRG